MLNVFMRILDSWQQYAFLKENISNLAPKILMKLSMQHSWKKFLYELNLIFFIFTEIHTDGMNWISTEGLDILEPQKSLNQNLATRYFQCKEFRDIFFLVYILTRWSSTLYHIQNSLKYFFFAMLMWNATK